MGLQTWYQTQAEGWKTRMVCIKKKRAAGVCCSSVLVGLGRNAWWAKSAAVGGLKGTLSQIKDTLIDKTGRKGDKTHQLLKGQALNWPKGRGRARRATSLVRSVRIGQCFP
jgi:hypothetical protein